MRILFCQTVPHLPQDVGGGLSNTDALCRMLAARQHQPMVLCREARSGMARLLPRPRASELAYPVVRAVDPLAAVAETCRSFRPELAVVQFGDVARMSAALTAAGIPILAYYHDTATIADTASSANAYAACSRVIAGRIREKLGVDATVLPVLIEPDSYRVTTRGDCVTLVNPIPRKGVEVAFALAARYTDISFLFVEAWRLRARVRTYLAQRVAHHGNIQLLPAVQDMRQIYAQTRLILAPSMWEEAWGRVVSEAQVSGIPALVSDSGGLPEAVGRGGVVVGRDAPIGEWCAALERLWSDAAFYEEKSGLALAHAAREEFTAGAIIDRFLDLAKRHARSS